MFYILPQTVVQIKPSATDAEKHSGRLTLDEADKAISNPARDDFGALGQQRPIARHETDLDDRCWRIGIDLVQGVVSPHIVRDRVGIKRDARLLTVTLAQAGDQPVLRIGNRA